MKPVKKLLVSGALVTALSIIVLTVYYFFDSAQFNNPLTENFATIQYRIISDDANLSAVVDFKAGRGSLSTQQVTLPWVSEIKKVVKKGEPIALYFSTYHNKPTSVTYEIWVDGKKMASQTDNSQDFISNNISCNY